MEGRCKQRSGEARETAGRQQAGLERRKMDGRGGGAARDGWTEIRAWIGGVVSGVRRGCLHGGEGGREEEGRGRRGEIGELGKE